MQVEFKRGVYLPELDLWLDSLRRRDVGLISHAHSDHTAKHQQPIVTPNTALLLSEYLEKSSPIVLDYHQPHETEKYILTLYPAGHCLGSAQTLVQSKSTGLRVLYTGDFKVRDSPTNEPLEPVPCDILIMESTYGRPEYTFPSQEQVLSTAYSVLRSWISRGEKPVVLLWRLGKSQELLHLLLGEGFDVAVEESIYPFAQAYQAGGVSFPGPVRPYDGRWPEGQVLICPPGRKSTSCLDGLRGLRFMELTGWATTISSKASDSSGGRRWGRRGDSSLPYSDHADFNELVEYVGRVQPQQVYTVNGFPELAAHLRQQGYPAVHLNGRGETVDSGFQMKLL